MYPTDKQLNDLRREFAVNNPRAPYHNIAIAREARGQAWDKNMDGRASADEKRYGIGDSRGGDAARMDDFRWARRAIRHGEAFA